MAIPKAPHRRRLIVLRFAILASDFLILWFLAQIAAAGEPGAGSTASPEVCQAADSSTSKYPLGNVSRWLPAVNSFQLRAEMRFDQSPEEIAKNLRKVKEQFPELKDPDPLVFRELLPRQRITIERDFDGSRIRKFTRTMGPSDQELSREVCLWDGKRAVAHYQNFRTGQNDFQLAQKPFRFADSYVFDFVPYLNKQPPMFWWDRSPESQKAFEQYRGTPADFVLVGQENYHGVDCKVFLSSVGNQSDRFFIGADDGRWYGAKEGIIAIPDMATYARTDQGLVEEFLGKKLGEKPAAAIWEDIGKTLRTLPQEKKVAWCRMLYSHIAKNHVPVFEYWFSDYRDLGSGRFFPFRQTLLFYDHEGQEKTFVGTTHDVTIKEISIDRSLDDKLFDEPLAEGASVVDDTHKRRLMYKYKAHFTPVEWNAILKEAQDREDRDAEHRTKVDNLIGKPAPPLPGGEWVNSQPLSWNDLRGKIVILKFWSVGCAPCYGELSALKAPLSAKHESRDAEHAPKETPIVFVGVHVAVNAREEIDKVIDKHQLRAPICIDCQASGDFSWGDFCAQCAVDSLPTTVAVDEEGVVLAHGNFSEVYLQAAQRSRQPSEQKDEEPQIHRPRN